jgi:hypothetical protein|tara:strand:- start:1033 stop:1794 length:762 start_codon:yes stop_codon:yes gene_type:complete
MCTLTVRFAPEDDYPVIIAANRDEFYNRFSAMPAIIETDPLIFAPKDMEAGGTWIGINEYGLLAAITNVWVETDSGGMSPGPDGDRSRGLLTVDILHSKTLEQAAEMLHENITKFQYQYFNLLIASNKGFAVFCYTGKLEGGEISDSATVINNQPYQRLDGSQSTILPFPKTENEERGWIKNIQSSLSRHPDICKHLDLYGTCCSQIIAISHRNETSISPLFPDKFWFAGGSPCETPFADLTQYISWNHVKLD